MSVQTAIRALTIGALCLTLAACKSTEKRAESYLESAQKLIAAGDADRAIIQLRNVFELVPTHAEARRALARLQVERGNHPGAYRNYLRLVEQLPEDIEGHTGLAELAFEGRNWEDFVRYGERTVELAPDAPRSQVIALALQYRTAALEKDGPAANAAAAQAEAMQAQAADSSLLEHILFDSYMRNGDKEQALDQLDKIIARAPTVRQHYYLRLQLLGEIGDHAAIEAHLRNVVKLFPEDDDSKAALIQYFVAANENDKVEAFLREISNPTDADPAYFVSLVQFLKETRGVDVALAEIETAIPVSPEPDRLRMLRAALDFEDGRQDEAIADLDEIVSRAEPSELTNDIKITLSLMLQSTGNEVGAQRLIGEVLEAHPDNVAALKIDAARLISVDETDAAIAYLRRALDSEPEDEEAYNLMADAYARAGSHDLALDIVAQAVDISNNGPESSLRYAQMLLADGNELAAEEVLIKALRRTPNHEDILILLGRVYISTQDFDRTEMVVSQLRKLGSGSALDVANRLQAGILAQREGNTEALNFLEQLAQDADAGLNEKVTLLRARLAFNRPQEALQMAEDLVAEAPEDIDRRALLALTRAASGDLEVARDDMLALVEEDPSLVVLWQQLYRIAQVTEGPEGASATLEKGLAALPDSPVLLWIRAQELEADGQIDAAIVIYEDLYARDSNSLIFANNLASLLVTYKEDADSLERAWAIARRLRDTDVPAFQDTYGWLAFRRGDPETALSYLEQAAEELPHDPVVQYHLAEVYAALDRPQDAATAYDRALAVASEDDVRPQVERARQKLAQMQQVPSSTENQ